MPHGPAVLLYKGRGAISAAIRWQTRSEYSHAAVLCSDASTVVEAWQGKGVRTTTLGDDIQGIEAYDVVWPDNLGADECWQDVEQFMLGEVGKQYDYRSVLRFVTRRKAVVPDKWFCSELVFAAVAFAGLKLLHRCEAWRVSPGMLAMSPLLRRLW